MRKASNNKYLQDETGIRISKSVSHKSLTSHKNTKISLRKKYPYSELVWSVFSHIRTKYEEILSISPYSVQMQENTDHNNSEYGHFLRSLGNYDNFLRRNARFRVFSVKIRYVIRLFFLWDLSVIATINNSNHNSNNLHDMVV